MLFINYLTAQISQVSPLVENNISVQSPDAASLGTYGAIPIGYSSGTTSINIPLYTIKEKELDLDISLSYNSSGIKVNQIASSVGLGWSLNAGGVITRAIQGNKADEEFGYGYLYQNNAVANFPDYLDIYEPLLQDNLDWWKKFQLLTDPLFQIEPSTFESVIDTDFNLNDFLNEFEPSSEQLDRLQKHTDLLFMAEKVYDSSPDMFYFNFNGYNGKFIIDNTGKVNIVSNNDNLTISYSRIKNANQLSILEKNYINSFVVRDTKGIKYIFENIETTKSYSTSLLANEAWYEVYQDAFWFYDRISFVPEEYKSSWFLTRIEMPISGNVINFEYEEVKQSFYGSVSEKYFYSQNTPLEEENQHYSNVDKNKVLRVSSKEDVESYRLSTITWSEGRIEFIESLADRKDINNYSVNKGKAIQKIKVFDNSSTIIKDYKFNFSYFNDFNGSNSWDGLSTSVYYDHESEFKRLRLNGIEDLSDGNIPRNYFFEYYDGHLPSRNSTEIDFWGYYKELESDSDPNNPINYIAKSNVYLYMDDGPENVSNKYWSIYSIYPRTEYTGNLSGYLNDGVNRFPDLENSKTASLRKIIYPTGGYTQFEYELNDYQFENEIKPAGGLRIKRIINNDGYNSETQKEFSYRLDNGNSSGFLTDLIEVAKFETELSYYPVSDANKFTVRFLNNQMGLTDNNNVNYSLVTESELGKGKTKYYFSNVANSDVREYLNEDIEFWKKPDKQISIQGDFPPIFERIPDESVASQWGQHLPESISQYLVSYNYFYDHNANYFVQNKDQFPFISSPNTDLINGNLIKKEIYDENNHLQEKTEFVYQIDNLNKVSYIKADLYKLIPSIMTVILIEPGIVFKEVNGMTEGVATYFVDNSIMSLIARDVRWGKSYYTTGVTSLKEKITTIYDHNGNSSISNTHYQYQNNSTLWTYPKLFKSEELTTTNEGDVVKTIYTYPQINLFNHKTNGLQTQSEISANLIARHQFPIIGVRRFINNKLILSDFINYSFQGTSYVPSELYKLETVSPISETNYLDGTNFPLTLQEEFKYNKEKLIHSKDRTGINKTYIWDSNKMISDVINALPEDVGFTSFENDDQNLWSLSNGTLQTAESSHTGKYSRKINSTINSNTVYGPERYFIPKTKTQKYVYSCWIKTSNGYSNGYLAISAFDNLNNYISGTWHSKPITDTQNEWKYFEISINLPEIYQSNPLLNDIKIKTQVYNMSSTGSFLVDDIRFHPENAVMHSLTYSPLVGITSQTDENNISKYFFYTNSEELKTVKDDDKNILKEYKYNYSNNGSDNSPFDCSIASCGFNWVKVGSRQFIFTISGDCLDNTNFVYKFYWLPNGTLTTDGGWVFFYEANESSFTHTFPSPEYGINQCTILMKIYCNDVEIGQYSECITSW